MQYLTSQLICFSLITPLLSLLFFTGISFPSSLSCFLFWCLFFFRFFFFLFVFLCQQFCYHLQYLKSAWAAALLHSATLTVIWVSDVQELGRKGQTWMMLSDLFWSRHWSKGPPSYHFFTCSFCFWRLLCWKVFEHTALCRWWCINTPHSQEATIFKSFSPLPFY